MTVTIKGKTTIKAATTVGFSPASLFAAGEQGVWYDPSDFSTMFQDTAGTTPVTATTQSVGCILDKRSAGYSDYFGGSSQYLSVAAGSGFEFGTGDFTVEGWFRVTTLSSVNGIYYYGSGDTNRLQMHIATDGSVNFYCEQPSGSYVFVASAASAVSINTWYHIAFVRNGNNWYIYLNGTQAGTASSNISCPSSQTPIIGKSRTSSTNRWMNGYISNFRVVKGTAVYTSSFTVPTSPLTAIANTSLLTCGNVWSSNPAITNTSVVVDKINPFGAGTGNHATQSTAGSRPTLQQDANGCYYLSFDGTDDWLETASINFSATNKVGVFSGIRKLSDASQGVVAELSQSSSTNAGTFRLEAPRSATENIAFINAGTTPVAAIAASGYPAPLTSVATGLGDISAPSAILRVNGVQAASTSSSQGTGNYGNYAFYIGRRGGSSLPFNGNLYGLIVRGAASTSTQIAAAEGWVNSKTRAY